MSQFTKCQKNIVFKKGLELLSTNIEHYLFTKERYNRAVQDNESEEELKDLFEAVENAEVVLASKFFDFTVACDIAMQGITQYLDLDDEEDNDGS